MVKIGRYKKSEKESNMKSGNKNIVSKKKKKSVKELNRKLDRMTERLSEI